MSRIGITMDGSQWPNSSNRLAHLVAVLLNQWAKSTGVLDSRAMHESTCTSLINLGMSLKELLSIAYRGPWSKEKLIGSAIHKLAVGDWVVLEAGQEFSTTSTTLVGEDKEGAKDGPWSIGPGNKELPKGIIGSTFWLEGIGNPQRSGSHRRVTFFSPNWVKCGQSLAIWPWVWQRKQVNGRFFKITGCQMVTPFDNLSWRLWGIG